MKLLTVEQAMDYTNLSRRSFYDRVKDGWMPLIHIGSKPLVIQDVLDRKLKAQLKKNGDNK